MRHMVLVADVANEGADFLRGFIANKVICYEDPVIARCREGSDQVRRVSVAEIVIVSAGTQMITEGKTTKP